MTEGWSRKGERLAMASRKRGGVAALDDPADILHIDLGIARQRKKLPFAIGRRSCRRSRNRRRRSAWSRSMPAPCPKPGRPPHEIGTVLISTSAETPEAAHNLPRSPTRPSDTSIAALACSAQSGSQRIARLRERDSGRADDRIRHGQVPIVAANFAAPQAQGRCAASPIVPVTITRSPFFAPLRLTMLPRGKFADGR